MSSVVIQGNVSGTGSITIESPNTNSDYTVILPASSGTLDTGFPAGTIMLFRQTSAPTGWTKDTTNFNNNAIRVVTGSVSSGGSVDFSTAFASQSVTGTVGTSGATTLSTAEMPSHTHGAPASGTVANGGTFARASASAVTNFTNAEGGGGSHTHSGGAFTGNAINLAVKYCDVIFATKD